MLNVVSSLKRPFTVPGRFILQAVLSIFPLSYITFPLTWGYLFECIKTTLAGEEQLPEWSHIVRIILNGLASFTVMVAYSLLGSLLVILSFPGRNPFDATDVPYLPTLIIGGILLILGAYLIGAAIVLAAANNDWKRAFYVHESAKLAFSIDYFIAAAVTLVLGAVIFAILYWVGTWTFLPGWWGVSFLALLGGFLGSYSGIVSFTLFAESYEIY